MLKWYQSPDVDSDIVLSSRIRLARNIAAYPFKYKISDDDAEKIIVDVNNAILNEQQPSDFDFIKLNQLNALEKSSMVEKHIISPELAACKKPCGVFMTNDESVSIMIGEEDHVRIQTIFAGNNILKAFDLAYRIDDLIEKSVEYAFDSEFGFLTSCPTNAGTGLRASYMVHVPALDSSEQFKSLLSTIGKLGITARGIYGEGTEPLGSIYQISNQVTLGKTEEEIINNLKNVIVQITNQEAKLREKIIDNKSLEFSDQVFRSIGILTHARKITSNEAMLHLSNIRLGYVTGRFKMPKPKLTIYEIIVNIQKGNFEKIIGSECDELTKDKLRADYIRNQFI